jgi:hypothetical protein
MLEASRHRILESVGDEETVLDIGGWADPCERADWVIDAMPYETRGLYEREEWIEKRERDPERFTPDRWIQRDLCDREPYPFEDGSIDFVICSQTLEDLRDPVWVCAEMNRVARAGYIEVPSRLEEQSWGVAGPFVGWSHHRWLIDVTDDRIEFMVKLHSLHARREQHFPSGFWEGLSEQERVQTLWWQGGFSYGERIVIDEEEINRYLREFVDAELARRGRPPSSGRGPLSRLRRRR